MADRLLDTHLRLAPLQPSGATAPWQPGDLASLTLQAIFEGEGSPGFPTARELGEILGESALVLSEPALSPIASADPPGLPAGSGRSQSATWKLQLLLPPGEHELGPVKLDLRAAGGSVVDSMEVPPFALQVGSALDGELAGRLDAAQGEDLAGLVAAELAPVRGPWVLAGRLDPAALAGAGLLLLALLAAAIFAWRRLRRPAAPAAVSRPPLSSPEVEARERLARLPARLDAGEHLAFHVELAEILKRYLGRRYEIDLLERTTEELRRLLGRELKDAAGLAAVREDVLRVLGACDLVKFARDLPTRPQGLASLQGVERVVDRTTPVSGLGEDRAEEAA